MENINSISNPILRKVALTSFNRAINTHPKHYQKDDRYYCGICNQPITTTSTYEDEEFTVGQWCECDKKREEQREREKLQNEVSLKRDKVIKSARYKDATFTNPKTKKSPIIELAKKYCDKWDQVFKKNTGLLFTGNTGTGKTWASYCIANALIDKNVSVQITTFPELFNKCKASFKEIDDIVKNLLSADCLIIDDLGAESFTNFNAQIIFQVIDSRYHQMKPLIVSTNLTAAELQNNPSLECRRVFDRIIDMCPVVEVTGSSLRTEDGQEKYKILNEL